MEALEKLERELRLRNYSPRTRSAYAYHVRQFLCWLPKEPRYAKKEDVEDWLLLLAAQGRAPASVNLAYNSVKMFYWFVFKRKLLADIPRMKEPQQLPKLLSREEIARMFDLTTNPKHRLLLAFLYSTGLRLSELRNLRHEDLDSARACGTVRGGKGGKDRLFHLSPEVVKLIGDGAQEGYIFPGRNGPYPVKSVQMIVKHAAERAGMTRHITPHMLRHSYATHSLEQGVDIRFIQELLGHANVKTTQIYTQISQASIKNVKLPIDEI